MFLRHGVRRTGALRLSFAAILFVSIPGVSANATLIENIEIRTGGTTFFDGGGLERGAGFNFLEGPRDGPFAGAFTAGDFTAAATGSSVYIVNPVNALWTASLPSDPLARWIGKGYTAEGGPGSQAGSDGVTALYAFEFAITSLLTPAHKVLLDVTYLADDAVGDANNEGLFINGIPLLGTKGNTATDATVPKVLSGIDITDFVTTGSNVFYFYANVAAGGAAGIILSGDVSVVDEPASLAVIFAGLLGIAAIRRKRRDREG